MFKIINNITKFKQLQKERWDIQGISAVPCFIHSGPDCGIIGMKNVLGYGYTKFIMQFENDYVELYYNREDMHRNFDAFMKRLSKDTTYMKFLINVDMELGEEMDDFIKHIKPKIDKMSLSELIGNYKKMFKHFSNAFDTSHLIESIALTTDVKLKDMLIKELEQRKQGEKFSEYFAILTQPDKMPFVVEADNSIYLIIEEIKKHKKLTSLFSEKNQKETASKEIIEAIEKEFPHIADMIKDHVDKFYWIKTTWTGGKYMTKPDFVDDLTRIIDSNEKLVYIPESKVRQQEIQKKELLKKLKLGKELVLLLKITSETTYWQDLRKIKMLKGILGIQRFISEISDKTGIKEQNLKYLLAEEECDTLLDAGEKKLEEIDHMLAERRKASVYLYSDDEMMILTGKEYEKFFGEMKELKETGLVKEINGMCASPGKAVGKARICLKPHNISKINEGDILVTSMTRPEFVPAMKKAAAIITDEGGLTCHAAIVSRELGKPCVIGTKVATKALKDGQIVEVNANHGVIRVVK